MLRGVNRRIIEISDTGSEYFEKALFFIRPESVCKTKALENEARKMTASYLEQYENQPRTGSLRYCDIKKRKTIKMTIGVLSVILLTIAAFVIFF